MTAEEYIAAKLDNAGFIEFVGKPPEKRAYNKPDAPVCVEEKPPAPIPVNLEPIKLFHDDAFGMAKIMGAVCRVTGLKVSEIVSPRRQVSLVKARMIFCYVARELTSRSLPQIGQFCGKRDHSTVHHAVACITKYRERFEPELSMVMDGLSTADANPYTD